MAAVHHIEPSPRALQLTSAAIPEADGIEIASLSRQVRAIVNDSTNRASVASRLTPRP